MNGIVSTRSAQLPRGLNNTRPGVLTVLDIGSSKISCFVAQTGDASSRGGEGTLRVAGIGHQLSRGIKGGGIIDMDATESAIRAGVETAERMAGITVRDVVVNVSCGRPKSEFIQVRMPVWGQVIGESDVARVLQEGRNYNPAPGRTLVHAVPCGFIVDGSGGVRDPRGMVAAELGSNVHIVSVESGPLSNLIACVERCHLEVAGLAVSPYAAGLSCLAEDEKDLGVICLDLGGGTSSLGIFYDGAFVHSDVITLGGNHITNDIARGLSTSVAHAERLKILHGSVLASPDDEHNIVDIQIVGGEREDNVERIPRSVLTGIIRPRVEEILEMVRDCIESSGFAHLAGKQIVLTGGGSQLCGIRELVTQILNRQARIGRPAGVAGLADATGGPSFSVCGGLLFYARQVVHGENVSVPGYESTGLWGRFVHVGQWLKENF